MHYFVLETIEKARERVGRVQNIGRYQFVVIFHAERESKRGREKRVVIRKMCIYIKNKQINQLIN